MSAWNLVLTLKEPITSPARSASEKPEKGTSTEETPISNPDARLMGPLQASSHAGITWILTVKTQDRIIYYVIGQDGRIHECAGSVVTVKPSEEQTRRGVPPGSSTSGKTWTLPHDQKFDHCYP